MHLFHFAILGGLVTLASAPARAQQPDTLTPAQRAGLALARLGAGQRVRIVTSEREFVDGSVVATAPGLVTLRTPESVIKVPAPRVDSLWVQHGSRAGRGALIGAIPGVVFLGGVLVTSGGPNGEARDIRNFSGLITGLVLLGGGVAVGALIGAATPKWQREVP